MLVPLGISFLYADGSWPDFVIPAAGMMLVGAAGFWATHPEARRHLEYAAPREVLFSVTLAWVLAAPVGGALYLIEGIFVSPVASTFEAMSGFTTTGAALLSDIEAQTPSILFFQSMTQWLGGIGIVVLFVGVAPVLSFGAARLLSAEVSGLGQPRLTPRIAGTAKALLGIYVVLTLAETGALLLAGMSLYDAGLHSFTTIATGFNPGGFNARTASVGFYDSVAIQGVIIFFIAVLAILSPGFWRK